MLKILISLPNKKPCSLITNLLFITVFFLNPSIGKSDIFFPAEENNIEMLPQVFEFQMPDDHHMSIGDQNINFLDFQTKMTKASPKLFEFSITLPKFDYNDSSIVLRDNTGKFLTSKIITEESGNKHSLTIENQSLIKKIELLPFFKVCLKKEVEPTRVLICSEDYTVKRKNSKFRFTKFPSTIEKSFVEVNGRTSNSQGSIFLNSETEATFMRVFVKNGYYLEIVTKKQKIDIRNVVTSPSTGKIIVQVSDSKPLAQMKPKKIAENVYEVEVEKERPIIFLSADSGVPLKQEFVIKSVTQDKLPSVSSQNSVPDEIYSDELKINLNVEPKVQIDPLEKDSELIKNDSQSYEWKLTNFPLNRKTRKHIRIKNAANNSVATAAVDITRRPAYDATVDLMFPIATRFSVSRHFSNQLMFQFNYFQQLLENQTTPEKAWLQGIFWYSFAGKNSKVYSAGLGYSQETFGNKDFANTSSNLTIHGSVQFFDLSTFSNYFNSTIVLAEISQPLSSTSKITKLPSVENRWRHNMGDLQYLDYGMRLSSLQASSDTYSSNKLNVFGIFGWGVRF